MSRLKNPVITDFSAFNLMGFKRQQKPKHQTTESISLQRSFSVSFNKVLWFFSIKFPCLENPKISKMAQPQQCNATATEATKIKNWSKDFRYNKFYSFGGT